MAGESLFLIQSPFFKDYGPMKKAAGRYFPLGLGYISACVKAHGYHVRFFDPNVLDVTPKTMASAAREDRPVLIGISFMTPQLPAVRELCTVLKSVCGDIPIVLGGAHPSVMPERTLMDIPAADLVVMGEAEQTVVELLDVVVSSPDRLDSVKGIALRKEGRIILTAPRQPLEELDSLPMPDRSLIDQSLYRAQSFLSYSRRAAAIHTSRGCPGRCVFCCSGYKLRAPVRFRSIENIMTEIDHLVDHYGIRYLLIKDDSFTINKARVLQFCDAISARHPGLKWHCMGRINSVDYDLLSRMKESGLRDIFFGIESGNEDILRRCRKGIKLDQASRAVVACDRLGIATYGAFILGLPGETRRTAEETISFACSLPLTMAGFSILIPYPGTQVFDDHYHSDGEAEIDYGSFIASTGLQYVEGYTGMSGLAPHELPALVSKAQRRFYLRPRQLARMMRFATPSMFLGYARGLASLIHKEVYRLTHRKMATG